MPGKSAIGKKEVKRPFQAKVKSIQCQEEYARNEARNKTTYTFTT